MPLTTDPPTEITLLQQRIAQLEQQLLLKDKELAEARSPFEKLFNAGILGLVIASVDGPILEANDTFLQMLGYTREDLDQGHLRWDQLTAPGSVEASRQSVALLQRDGVCPVFEKQYIHKDGHLVDVLLGSSLISRSPDTAVTYILDISCRRATERRLMVSLRNSEKQFRILADRSPIMIYMSDAAGTYTYINEQYAAFLGIGAGEMLAGSTADFLHPEDADAARRYREALRQQQELEMQVRLRSADGSYRPVSLHIRPFYSAEDRFLGHIAALTDMTLREEIRKEMLQLLKRKDEFISIASHELNTPFTSIKTGIQLIRQYLQEGRPTEAARLSDTLLRHSTRMEALINDLLAGTSLRQGLLQLHPTPFSIPEFFRDLEEHSHLTDHKHHFRFLIPQDDAWITADRRRMEQAMHNLISNAVKYAPAGTLITVSAVQDQGNWRFSVHDEGPGIPQDEIPFLFERYYRLEGGRHISGLGLGLYLCREIAERHGGYVQVSATEGSGTTFSLVFPQDRPMV